MNNAGKPSRLRSGIPGLDAILSGGLPLKTVTVVGGAPGSGKTILSQQLIFQNATPENPAVFFQTLSEPTAKTLGYLQKFDFFDASKIGKSIFFVDLGDILRGQGLEKAKELFVKKMKTYKPAFVTIDSFKVFSDLAKNNEELRKFSYDIAIHLLVWECTAFLLGEYSEQELATNPLSSICDSIFMLDSEYVEGEFNRFIRVLKLRGTGHSQNTHRLDISNAGLRIYIPERKLRGGEKPVSTRPLNFVKTGMKSFDTGLGRGLLTGSTQLIVGASGTGKSTFALEMLYRGALELNERGIYFSFDENEDEICEKGKELGWNLKDLIKRGTLKIVTFFRDEIILERDIVRIEEEITAFKAKRVVLDSLGIFLNKEDRPQVARERAYQLISIFKDTGTIGFLTVNAPYGSTNIGDLGIEETLADGIILLSNRKEDGKRKRTLEIYKLRNSAHLTGEFPMLISAAGITVQFPKVSETKAEKI